ncbi:MAG: lysine--tRNA ligase [Bryobacterales bacterium]|nr:lysine--tRNA ligase [Bryobacterales bacterium]
MSEAASQTPLEQLRNARLQKIDELRTLGLDPFPSTSSRTHYSRPLVSQFEEFDGKPVTVAGRLVSWRKQGGMAFGHIQDQTGEIQIVLRRQTLEPTDPGTNKIGYDVLRLLDLGDFIEIKGTVAKTQRGEISVMADSLRMLAKSLRPLPDKFSGIKDREIMLRKRYLDSVANPDVRPRFEMIGKMLFAIREFLYSRGFLEFTTPIIQPQYGGGTAKPFRTYVNALSTQMYLSISHELYLKRLIAAGFDKVFTIGRYFRNEGIDRSHHPEFTMIETMTAYENYEYNMELVESLFRHVAVTAFGKTEFQVGEHRVDFGPPWKRILMADAVKEATGVDFREVKTVEEANQHLAAWKVEPAATVGHALVEAFESLIAPKLIQPTLVYGHPVEISPLAKPMRDDPRFVERFEIMIGGMECGDNWSEQNDPIQLHERWKQMYRHDSTEGEFQPLDYDFLEVLEHGMPPTTGIGPGIERMAMIFSEQSDIYDVIFFPMMKPVISQANQAIYGLDVQQQPESDVRKSAFGSSDIVIDLAGFEQLAADARLQPHGEVIALTPSLTLFPPAEGKGAASLGHVGVHNLLPGSAKVLVSVYRNQGKGELETSAEIHRLKEAAGETLLPVLGRLYPGMKIEWR